MSRTVRKCCTGLFVPVFPVNNEAVSFFAKFIPAVPNFFYKRTGGIVLIRIDSLLLKFILNFNRSTKSRYNCDILLAERFNRYLYRSIRIKQKLYTPFLKIFIYGGIMNHFTQQVDVFTGIFLNRTICDINGIFDTIAETEMPGDQETDSTE